LTQKQLAEKLYHDAAGYSILTEPLNNVWVTRIDIRAWNDVSVHLANGKVIRIESFLSPEQEEKILLRIFPQLHHLQSPVKKLQNGCLSLTAMEPPVVPKENGICCVIRKLKQRRFSEQSYLVNGFAVQKELHFIQRLLQYGVSVLLAGKKGTGLTSFAQFLLSSLPNLRTVTVQQNTRELSGGINLLIDKADFPDYMEHICSLEPDLIIFNDSFPCAEDLSLQGYTVLSQLSAGSVQSAFYRMVHRYRKRTSSDFLSAVRLCCEAFPVIVLLGTLPDGLPRIMEISECRIEQGQAVFQPIWKFETREISYQSEEVHVNGRHRLVGPLSESLLYQMMLHGLTSEECECLRKEKNDAGRESNWPTGFGPADAGNQKE
jgi:hypothetical protein